MTQPFDSRRYYALTLDPVHVGTGGFRLGRVDNTIVREPGTNVPKIPGSSIAGVARAYTAMHIQSYNPAKKKYHWEEGGKSGSCAGKGVDNSEEGDGHCGKNNCEVCTAYGFSKKKESFQGLAQFYDARILFFPAQSSKGPVWITSPSLLREYFPAPAATNIKLTDADEQLQTFLVNTSDKINIGWLYLPNKEKVAPIADTVFTDAALLAELKPIINRLVVLPDSLFSRMVNDNLEVRTSVAINPETGAAEDKALYTYEAIPRATVMAFDIVYNDPIFFKIGGVEIKKDKDDGSNADTEWVRTNVKKGLEYFAFLGIGGMNTRGMGRFKVLNPEGVPYGN
jgi:CRISPR-associated protein Cmr4